MKKSNSNPKPEYYIKCTECGHLQPSYLEYIECQNCGCWTLDLKKKIYNKDSE